MEDFYKMGLFLVSISTPTLILWLWAYIIANVSWLSSNTDKSELEVSDELAVV